MRSDPKRVLVLRPGQEVPEGFEDAQDIDVTSRSKSPLSPFLIGGTHAADNSSSRGGVWFNNFENMWQYSKVYRTLGHVQEDGMPSEDWRTWMELGAAKTEAVRYPAGRGAKPEYLFWQGRKLSYLTARKLVYIPKYLGCIRENSEAYDALGGMYKILKKEGKLILRDFDCYPVQGAYDWQAMLDNPYRKFGHGLVLAQILEHGSMNAYTRIIV